MKEFDEARKRISEDIQRFLDKPTDSFGQISEAMAQEAQTQLMELTNPVILTRMHEIRIQGKAFLTSSQELIKVLKTRYTTPGVVNVFPKIVDDFLRTGRSSELSRLGEYDMSQALPELRQVARIVSQTRKESIVFLSNIDPISLLSEYTIDGRHTSSTPLRAMELPVIVSAEEASFQFVSASGVKISDGRTEKDMVINLLGMSSIISGVENNIVATQQGKSASRMADFVAILSILFLGLGIAFLFARRGRFWELGIPMAAAGAVLFYMRYYSEFGKEYFAPAEIEIYGEAPVNFQFYGELL